MWSRHALGPSQNWEPEIFRKEGNGGERSHGSQIRLWSNITIIWCYIGTELKDPLTMEAEVTDFKWPSMAPAYLDFHNHSSDGLRYSSTNKKMWLRCRPINLLYSCEVSDDHNNKPALCAHLIFVKKAFISDHELCTHTACIWLIDLSFARDHMWDLNACASSLSMSINS